MTVLVVRYTVRDDCVDEVRAAIEKVVSALEEPPAPELLALVGSYRLCG